MILNDNEILENLCRKNTKRYNKLSLYERFSEKDANNLLRIGYLAQSSNITITATLLYENELSSDEIAYTDR